MSSMNIICCSDCFVSEGLRLDAIRLGKCFDTPCPVCGNEGGYGLSKDGLLGLAHSYFSHGSRYIFEYGSASLLNVGSFKEAEINSGTRIDKDISLIHELTGEYIFYASPRYWMFGENDFLKRMKHKRRRNKAFREVFENYPGRLIRKQDKFYRIRIDPSDPDEESQYDSPPEKFLGSGRFDSKNEPVMYASPDLDLCIHESRAKPYDNIFVATLSPARDLKMLDLSFLVYDPDSTEFESMDIAVHMMMLSSSSYDVCRDLASYAREYGYDGIVHSSYFSHIKTGTKPFQTIFGLSYRILPQMHNYEKYSSVPNYVIFGRPIRNELVGIKSIDKVIISRIRYDYHFGPSYQVL